VVAEVRDGGTDLLGARGGRGGQGVLERTGVDKRVHPKGVSAGTGQKKAGDVRDSKRRMEPLEQAKRLGGEGAVGNATLPVATPRKQVTNHPGWDGRGRRRPSRAAGGAEEDGPPRLGGRRAEGDRRGVGAQVQAGRAPYRAEAQAEVSGWLPGGWRTITLHLDTLLTLSG